jgi:hypothetical protein
MKRTISVFNIALSVLLSFFLLVQSAVAVTDIHTNSANDMVSLHHIDSHGSLTNHNHTDQDNEQAHAEHCCHAYSATSITTTIHISIVVTENISVSLPSYDEHYLNPHLDRLQRPPKA